MKMTNSQISINTFNDVKKMVNSNNYVKLSSNRGIRDTDNKLLSFERFKDINNDNDIYFKVETDRNFYIQSKNTLKMFAHVLIVEYY